jgi:hypothetical protein
MSARAGAAGGARGSRPGRGGRGAPSGRGARAVAKPSSSARLKCGPVSRSSRRAEHGVAEAVREGVRELVVHHAVGERLLVEVDVAAPRRGDLGVAGAEQLRAWTRGSGTRSCGSSTGLLAELAGEAVPGELVLGGDELDVPRGLRGGRVVDDEVLGLAGAEQVIGEAAGGGVEAEVGRARAELQGEAEAHEEADEGPRARRPAARAHGLEVRSEPQAQAEQHGGGGEQVVAAKPQVAAREGDASS